MYDIGVLINRSRVRTDLQARASLAPDVRLQKIMNNALYRMRPRNSGFKDKLQRGEKLNKERGLRMRQVGAYHLSISYCGSGYRLC